jgi:hypothetical protein
MLEQILANQNHIYPLLEKFMATTPVTLAQLTTDVTTLQTALTTGLTDLAAEIANLKASNPTVDFSALDAVVTGMTAQVQAADPGAQTPPAAAATKA